MIDSYSSRQMRRVRDGVTVVMFLLAFGGQLWRNQPAGRVTRVAIGIARAVCPGLSSLNRHGMTVAGGAHALDVAVFDRALDATFGARRCRAPGQSE